MSWKDVPLEVARAICGDGFGQGLKFNINDVAASAAYNKMRGYAGDVISSGVSSNIIAREEADALRKVLDKGGQDAQNAMASEIGNIAKNLSNTDNETAKKVASNFTDNFGKYNNARDGASVESYAEFLGREKGTNLGLMHTASGYFLDAQHGSSRMKTAAVAGVGVGIGARVLSGGTLTQTNTGERDIAGIPFI